ncbi:uncharacterized protein LOC131927120 [Physella acuta]|uniref:uncharacterized protein LOC131927120 n=1 Tax=Physella acuta TaxID=109671 RepID=UPI0027DBC0B7|nr:uncharacterized protein LOC131927120 [Physella acuta]
MPLSVRTVLVTGASRGIGLEFVRQLLKLTPPPEVVIAACRNPASAGKLQEIAQTNANVKIIKLDIEKDDDLESAFQETKNAVGDKGLNLLINNAGIFDKNQTGTLSTLTRELMQHHFNVNVSGPLVVTQKFLPLITQAASQDSSKGFSASRAGILMLSSAMGSQERTFTQGHGVGLHYKCSKTALTMAAIMISRELKDSGILVLALHPGWVRTDMGSDQAPVSPEDSVSGLLDVVGKAGEDLNGKLVTFDGEVLPY